MNLVEKFREKPTVRPLVPGDVPTNYAEGHPRIAWGPGGYDVNMKIWLRLGYEGNSHAYFSPNGLRQFGEFLIALADQEDAAGK